MAFNPRFIIANAITAALTRPLVGRKDMDILKVLPALEELEGKAAKLDQRRGAVFGDDGEAADFFKERAQEEQSRFNIVKFEVGLVWKGRQQFSDVEFDREDARQCVDPLSCALEEDSRPLLEEALSISIRLENSAAELHYRPAIIESNPQIKKAVSRERSLCRKALNRGVKPAALRFETRVSNL